jgi:hypothetical protein
MLQQQYARQADKAGNSVRPVVAFLSEEELKQSIQPGIQEKADRLGIVFKQEFFCPDSNIQSHTAQLHYAVELARDPEFIKARRALNDLQEDMTAKGYTDRQAIEKMKDLLSEYQKAQRKATWERAKRFGFIVLELAVPGAKELGLISSMAALGAEGGIKIVDWALGCHPEPNTPGLQAAAAIHTANKELSLKALAHRAG